MAKKKKSQFGTTCMKENSPEKDRAGIKKDLTKVKNVCIRNTTDKVDNGK